MNTVEREYAEALFAIAAEKEQVELYRTQLGEICDLVTAQTGYLEFLSSPAIDLTERLAAIDEAFSAHYEEEIISFLKLLCENRRIERFVQCAEEFFKLCLYMSGRVMATVTSAVELNELQRTALVSRLQTITQKKVDAVFQIEPAILGGIRIEVDGKTYDGTLLGRLRDVKDVMSR